MDNVSKATSIQQRTIRIIEVKATIHTHNLEKHRNDYDHDDDDDDDDIAGVLRDISCCRLEFNDQLLQQQQQHW